MAKSVVAADGRTWRVGRRWFPHRARFRSARWGRDASDAGDLAEGLSLLDDRSAAAARSPSSSQ